MVYFDQGNSIQKKIVHCCKLMTDFIDDKRVQIGYRPRYRDYFIPLLNQRAIQGIFYCPWCGTKLPADLLDEYFDTLEKEYNIDDPDRAEEAGVLPEEFKSNEWWKERKL